jgi:hypothetical protein
MPQTPDPGRIHHSATNVMSALMAVVGFAVIVRTVIAGGGLDATGILLGAMLMLAGVLRLYAQNRAR